LRSPEDYGDTFKVLDEGGILDEEFATKLVSMARFRNRLVHLYWDVDNVLPEYCTIYLLRLEAPCV
jgi:uncharacterized protein YutE (UPF0331/DUF86 family)